MSLENDDLQKQVKNEDGIINNPNIPTEENLTDQTSESGEIRDKLAEKFRAKFGENKDTDSDEDVRDFINQKEERKSVDQNSPEKVFSPIKPNEKFNYGWTILLVFLIIVALTAIVILVMSGRGSKNVTLQEQLTAYNTEKSKFDKIFLQATNNLNEAEASFNAKKYVEANNKAKEAEDDFNEAVDYLYDAGQVSLPETEFKWLGGYFDKLDEVTELGEEMANIMAYAARSADRGDTKEVESSLDKYHTDAEKMTELMAEIEIIRKNNRVFFEE